MWDLEVLFLKIGLACWLCKIPVCGIGRGRLKSIEVKLHRLPLEWTHWRNCAVLSSMDTLLKLWVFTLIHENSENQIFPLRYRSNCIHHSSNSVSRVINFMVHSLLNRCESSYELLPPPAYALQLYPSVVVVTKILIFWLYYELPVLILAFFFTDLDARYWRLLLCMTMIVHAFYYVHSQ